MKNGLIAALLMLVPGMAAAQPAPVQSYDTYKSWLLACDNTLSCVAKGYDDAGDARAEMRIARAGGPAGLISAAIRSDAAFRADGVRADGVAVRLPATDWTVAKDGDGTTISTGRLDAIRTLLAAVGDAQTLTLGAGDAHIPLGGLRAALLRMDVRQGRVGTVTALARKGDGPAASVPPALAVPRIAAHPVTATLRAGEAATLIARTRTAATGVFKAESCEADTHAFEPEAHALDGDRALVLIPCLMGAYQGSALTYLTARKPGGPIARLVPTMPYQGARDDAVRVTMVTTPDFDPKTGELTMFAKGRGLADCGTSATWVWDGRMFRLTALANQDACGGVDPGDWPVLFRSVR